ADLPRVRRGGTRPPRAPHPRAPKAPRASRGRAWSGQGSDGEVGLPRARSEGGALMAPALVSAVGIALAGLVATVVFGLSGTDVPRHIAFGIFSTMITLLAHSMMMFYLIGKGKAVKDAMKEHNVAGDYYARIGAARKPVFSIGTLAMAVTMVAAIMG